MKTMKTVQRRLLPDEQRSEQDRFGRGMMVHSNKTKPQKKT